MEKQRKEEEEDRISQLPQALLHHILCFLSQKQAVQTCVLSKSWRHLGPTRPRFKFSRKWFDNEEEFLSVLETTLQKFQDQKLSIDDFGLDMSDVDYESMRFLKKWVPEVFRAQNLYLERCNLNQINVGNGVFRHLERLSLKQVVISDETFEKIMLCCPSIEDVSLKECDGLETIKVTDKLKRFEFVDCPMYKDDEECFDIKIDDVQTIERIRIMWGCPFWFEEHCQKNFMHLKVLCPRKMRLSTESFSTFSSQNFPCLEDLTLDSCYGFEEIKLSSCSIERLTLSSMRESLKVTIHAPNILYFKYESYDFLPSPISFTTASGRQGWKSDLWLRGGCIKDSSCFFKLHEVLRALSQSEISLEIYYYSGFPDHDVEHTNNCGLIERVAVERLVLRGDEFSKNPRSSYSSFLTLLFGVCHPRIIDPLGFCAIQGEKDEELAWLLYKFLLQIRKGGKLVHLEEFDTELCDDVGDELLYRMKRR